MAAGALFEHYCEWNICISHPISFITQSETSFSQNCVDNNQTFFMTCLDIKKNNKTLRE